MWRPELNQQSGRGPDHHQDAKSHNGKSTAFDHLAPLGMSAVFRPDYLAGNLHQGLLCHISGAMLLPVVCQASTGSHLFFKSLRYRLDLRVFPSCHCMRVHTDTDQITRWINSRLRWPELIPARMVFAGILSATSQVSYFHPSGYYRCASACAFTTTLRALILWFRS